MNITIDFTTDTKEILAMLAGAIATATGSNLTTEATQVLKKLHNGTVEAVKEAFPGATEVKVTDNKPKYTLEQIQKSAKGLSVSKGAELIKRMLSEAGVKKISLLPEEKFNNFAEMLIKEGGKF